LCVCVCVCVCVCPPVTLSVSPNLQQVFSGSSVDLSCVDDGQTADGWSVRTRGGLTEDCGAAAGFGRLLGSYCVVDLSAPSETFWCEDSSGQQSDRVSFSVQSDTTDKGVILEIPVLPVRTGSDVILRCRQRNGATVAAYFFIKGPRPKETKPEHIITKVQHSDEGLYSCSTDQGGKSPESFLRVRGQNTDITSCFKRPDVTLWPDNKLTEPSSSSLLQILLQSSILLLTVLLLPLSWSQL
uniref:Ig-like domain-containing protein n=1 Tax=Oreochromis niloticus TaxID=8128 RepID=A0A669E3M0_ORENI